jgi:hypothetical protein
MTNLSSHIRPNLQHTIRGSVHVHGTVRVKGIPKSDAPSDISLSLSQVVPLVAYSQMQWRDRRDGAKENLMVRTFRSISLFSKRDGAIKQYYRRVECPHHRVTVLALAQVERRSIKPSQVSGIDR